MECSRGSSYYFSNPNYLAESITSENLHVRKLALELMNSDQEHIFKGIGWYLHNGTFIEKNHDKILFALFKSSFCALVIFSSSLL